MTDNWTDCLSDYVDDELAPAERRALESHLENCCECTSTLVELRAVVARAQELGEMTPEMDLWPAIAARVRETPQQFAWWENITAKLLRGKRVSLSVPQFVGIAAALVAATAAVVVLSRGTSPEGTVRSSDPRSLVTVANFADPQYDAAVADLKRALETGRDRLDPRTVTVLEENLAIIDGAIAQARQALAADPANTYLNNYLAEARRRKLELLRQVTGLADLAS